MAAVSCILRRRTPRGLNISAKKVVTYTVVFLSTYFGFIAVHPGNTQSLLTMLLKVKLAAIIKQAD